MADPKFVIYTGPMFGGKTTRMLSQLERAKYQRKSIILFKPKRDDRYSSDRVHTHSCASWPAVEIEKGSDIFSMIDECEVIAVDEAFMIDGIADALIRAFKLGKSIYVSSIQLSSSLEPFDEIMRMMPWATQVEVCPAVCTKSGNDAYYTIAKREKKEQIEVGGEETYEPRSWKHALSSKESI